MCGFVRKVEARETCRPRGRTTFRPEVDRLPLPLRRLRLLMKYDAASPVGRYYVWCDKHNPQSNLLLLLL